MWSARGGWVSVIACLVVVVRLAAALGADAPETTPISGVGDLEQLHSLRALLGRRKDYANKNAREPPRREAAARYASSQEAAPRISRGSDVECGRYPYMVSLRDNMNHHKCGGVLIGSRWVLTAAHCVDPDSRGSVGNMPLIVIGACGLEDKTNAAGPVEVVLPSQTILHEDWTGNVLDGSDIALLELPNESIHTAISLPMPNYVASTADMLAVLGWGEDQNGDLSTYMQQGLNMRLVPNQICEKPTIWGSSINDGMMCAFAVKFNGDSCEGDSGGPLLRAFAPDGNVAEGVPNLDMLLGLTSFGEKGAKCGETIIPGVYTSVTHFLPWINHYMQGTADEVYTPRPSPPARSHVFISRQRPIIAHLNLGAPTANGSRNPQEDQEDNKEASDPHHTVHLHPVPSPRRSPEPEREEEPKQEPKPEPVLPRTGGSAVMPPPPSSRPPPFVLLPLSPAIQFSAPDPETDLNAELLTLAGARANASSERLAQSLLSRGADADACCNDLGRPALHAASARDNVPVARTLIVNGADVLAMDAKGHTALHVAAIHNSDGVAEMLIAAGADVNAQDAGGETPLHHGALWGSWRVVDLLLKAGANRAKKDMRGRAPMEVVCEKWCRNKRNQAIRVKELLTS